MVSHDLQNPLAVAEGSLALAMENCESDHLDRVARSHDRMNALIGDLLTLAREGAVVGAMEAVDLAALVEESWASVGTSEAALTVQTDRTVQANRGRLRQLVENLLRNAVEHGPPAVSITLADTEDGFYVADDGPGIPADKRDQIFEANFSAAAEGTGFDLRIVKQVADAHGWKLRVTGSENGGARFEIAGL